jgi:hypothetical protein
MAAAASLRGIDESAVANAPAAAPVLAGCVGRDEERLAPTLATRTKQPPAAKRSRMVGYESQPRISCRAPTREHSSILRVQVRDDLPHVERPAYLNDVRVALGPLVGDEPRGWHLLPTLSQVSCARRSRSRARSARRDQRSRAFGVSPGKRPSARWPAARRETASTRCVVSRPPRYSCLLFDILSPWCLCCLRLATQLAAGTQARSDTSARIQWFGVAATLAWCLTLVLPTPTLATTYQETPTNVSLDTIVAISGTVDGTGWACPQVGTDFVSPGNIEAPVGFSLTGPTAAETIASDAFSITNPTLVRADQLCPVPGMPDQSTTGHFEITDYVLSLPAFTGTFDLFATSLQTSLTYSESFAYRVLVGGTLLGSGTISRDITTPRFTISILHQDAPPPGIFIGTISGGGPGPSNVSFNLLTGSLAGHSVNLNLTVLVTGDVVFEATVTTTTSTSTSSTVRSASTTTSSTSLSTISSSSTAVATSSTTTSTGLGNPTPTLIGVRCSGPADCEVALTGALPHVEGVRNRRGKRIARELLRLDRKMDRVLEQAANSPGHKQSRRYANARRVLARLLQVARVADHRGILGVPLGPIEAAASELLQRLSP